MDKLAETIETLMHVQCGDPINGNGLDKAIDNAIELLEQLMWIPVSERLPEDEEDVLLYGEGKGIVIGYRSEGTWYDYQHYHLTGRTHWMTLPQPPKEGDD